MSDIQESKSLRWLSNMFPFTKNPINETDKMSNAIHIYCEAGANKIDSLQQKVEMLQEYIQHNGEIITGEEVTE